VAVLESAIKADGGATERATRLKELQAQLAALKAKYPADHPEVVRLQRTYALLEGAVKAGGGSASTPRLDKREARKPDNPVYTTLQEQLDTANAQLQSLQAERTDTRNKLAQLDARVNATPEAEREYLELARDLDSSRARFRELREKQMQAQVAEQLERDRKAERFTLIEPAIFPEKPYRPNRGLILLVGFFLAAGGGVSSAVVRESLDRTVHAPRDVSRVMQVPVLAVIPAVTSAGERRRRVLRRRLAIAAVLLAGLLALALFHFLYMPLDVAWYGVMRRIFN
jgi:uncharacterized protein involved in exopolysaccharide biosynthesis